MGRRQSGDDRPRIRGRIVRVAVVLASAVTLAAPGAAQARTAYVTNSGSDSVTPIDLATGTAGTPILVGDNPAGVAITPDGATAYVTNRGSDNVTPIDLATGTAGTPILVGDNPAGVAITPDGATAYVTNRGSDNVTPIDLATGTAGTPILVGDLPVGVAIAPDGATAYVANLGSDSLTPIDVATGTAGTPITVGDQPLGVTITPDGVLGYVANGGSSNVTPIDVTRLTALQPIAAGLAPSAIAITPDGLVGYVANGGSNNVTPIFSMTFTAGSPITVGADPAGIALTPDGATAYVSSLGSDSVTPIALATGTAGSPIAVGADPAAIAFVPNRGPVAAFSTTGAPVGATTPLDGAASADADGTVGRYDWDFGDGTVLADGGAAPGHAFTHVGTYTVTLMVTDQEGCSTAFVFTGQTASCIGSSAARTTTQVTVAKGTPTVSAAAGSGDVSLGGSLYAGATLAGGATPTGQITFALYGPGDVACAAAPVFTDTVAVNAGNNTYRSGTFTPAIIGSYRWTATYSGDADHLAAASGCGAAVTVSAAPPLLLGAPGLVITSGAFGATCRASSGTLRSCRVTVRRAGATGSPPLALGRATSAAGAPHLTVRLRLTAAGRHALARALGGVRVTLHAEADTALRAQRSLRLLARTHRVAPAGAMFGPGDATLTGAGRRFLARVRAQARNVGTIQCAGRTAATSDGATLSLARARAACRHLRRLGLRARYRAVGRGAGNRDVAVTITHRR